MYTIPIHEHRFTTSNKSRPQHTHNDRRQVSVKNKQVLSRPIFSIGYLEVECKPIFSLFFIHWNNLMNAVPFFGGCILLYTLYAFFGVPLFILLVSLFLLFFFPISDIPCHKHSSHRNWYSTSTNFFAKKYSFFSDYQLWMTFPNLFSILLSSWQSFNLELILPLLVHFDYNLQRLKKSRDGLLRILIDLLFVVGHFPFSLINLSSRLLFSFWLSFSIWNFCLRIISHIVRLPLYFI